jgi:predicted DNA-binding transcriptional regulator AlpA
MSTNPPTKVAVSVAEMSKMVGLSRARFYQLMEAGVFPRPERHAESGRPFYSEEQQKVVLDVRRRNCGINGQPVLFYARRLPSGPTPAKPTRSKTARAKPTPKAEPHADLLAAVHALGLTAVTAAQLAKAVVEVFPNGTTGVDDGELVRSVFLRLKLGLSDPSAGMV